MIAVIETGAKQYLVTVGSKISVEKLAIEPTKKVVFDKVLLIASEDGKTVELGSPYVSGKNVEGVVLEQIKEKKVVVSKFKNKVRYRRKTGHRQPKTLIEIKKI